MDNNSPLTILYVHSSDEMYGSDQVLLQLVEGIDKARYHPIVVLPTDMPYSGSLTKELDEKKITVIHQKLAVLRRKYFGLAGILIYFFRFFKSTYSLMQIIRKYNVAMVHSNTLAVIPGALAAKLMGIPHVWHVHEIIIHPRSLWRITSWILPRLSDKVVAVSEATREHLSTGNQKNFTKTIVIHNGLNIKEFGYNAGMGNKIRLEWKIPPNCPLIGMVGRINHWKGQDYFLKVASLVARRCPEANFAIVGGTVPGQEDIKKSLHQLAEDLGLSRSLLMEEFRTDIPEVLDAFDILIFPSTLPDPFGMVVLEAMAAARPVVANAHGGCTEIINDGVTGILVEPNQPQDMADAIVYLIKNPTIRMSMGKAGKERLESNFSMKVFIEKWSKLYEQLKSPDHYFNTSINYS